MNNPGITFVCLTCLITYVFILFLVLALCKSAKLVDKIMMDAFIEQMNNKTEESDKIEKKEV